MTVAAIDQLQQKTSFDNAEVSLDEQLIWNQFNTCFITHMHESWWDQIPLGQTIAKLSRYKHANPLATQHLMTLFKIESLDKHQSYSRDMVYFSLRAYQNWLEIAQHLGLMMLSVPLSMEIDGKLKLKFVESFGSVGDILTYYAAEEGFRHFYKCVTFKNLRLLCQTPAEQLLREVSFEAWSLLSLVLPKSVTQRVHLTLDADWVAQIQQTRTRLSNNDMVSNLMTHLLPTINHRLQYQLDN